MTHQAAPALGRGNHMRVAGLGAQDLGEPRCGSSTCGACSSYNEPSGASEYSATAWVTSFLCAPRSGSGAASRDTAATGEVDREEVTGRRVWTASAAQTSIAAAISGSNTV